MKGKAGIKVNPTGDLNPRLRLWRKFLRNPLGVVGTLVFLIIVFSAIFAPLISPFEPTQQNLRDRLKPPVWQEGGEWRYPLGTDQVGRDVLSRLIWGARISLSIGISAVILGAVLGSVLGLLAGFIGGRVDNSIMLFVDVMMAFPALILALAFSAVLAPGMINIVLVLALVEWARYARLVRGETLTLKERDFVVAARALGQRLPQIMFRQIFPNLFPSIIVLATLRLAAVILTESSLSFLGLGTAGRVPSWGMMIAHGREVIMRAWWLPTIPGVAILLTVLSVNLVGDRIRDVFDPRVD